MGRARPGLLRLARFHLGLAAGAGLVAALALVALALLPAVVGPWTATVVGSGSMRPALEVGDVVGLAPVAGRTVRPREVVLVEDPTRDRPLLHRVLRASPGGYVTKGDANPTPDSAPVPAHAVRASGRLVVPGIGWPLLWAAEGRLAPLAALLAALLVLAALARYGWSDVHDPWVAPVAADPPPPTSRRRRPWTLARAFGLLALLAGGAVLAWDRPAPAESAFAATAENSGAQLLTDLLAPATNYAAAVTCGVTTPAVIGIATASAGTSAVALPVPAAAAAGDLLLAHVVSPAGVTPPAGFTVLDEQASTSGFAGVVLQKVATASDLGTTKSFTTGSSGSGGLLVVRNAAGLVQESDTAGSGWSSTGSFDAPSVTTSVAHSALLAFFGVHAGGAAWGPPSGMSSLYAYGGTKGTSNAASIENRPFTGPTGTRTATVSPPGEGTSHAVVVAPTRPARVNLSWTATTSSWAAGYEVRRDGVVVATLASPSTTTWTDTSPPSTSTAYTVAATKGTWRSATVSRTVTASC